MPIEEFRRQMLGVGRVEMLYEAGYDAVADLRESRGVHRKLLSSDNDLVRFKAVELDHKIHGTLAPQAVHDPTPRFSVSIRLDGNLHNAPYRNDKDNPAPNQRLGEAVKDADPGVVDTVATHRYGQCVSGARPRRIQESPPTGTPQSRRAKPLERGAPTQSSLARPQGKAVHRRAGVPSVVQDVTMPEKPPRARRQNTLMPRPIAPVAIESGRRCSACGNSGHNARTCGRAQP